MLRRARPWVIAIGVFLVGSRGVAQSAPLAEAMAAYEAGRLDEAVAGFERALTTPGNGPTELATIHLHLGILRASLGDLAAARAAFEIALALRPDTAAPSELGPAQLPAFEQARTARAGQPLRVASTAFGRRALDVRVTGAPERLVSAVVVSATLQSGETQTSRIEGIAGTTPLASSVRSVEVSVVDAHGGVLARVPVRLPALVPTAEGTARGAQPRHVARGGVSHEPRADAHDTSGGFFSTPWPWIVLGAIATAAIIATIVIVTTDDEYVVGRPMVPR